MESAYEDELQKFAELLILQYYGLLAHNPTKIGAFYDTLSQRQVDGTTAPKALATGSADIAEQIKKEIGGAKGDVTVEIGCITPAPVPSQKDPNGDYSVLIHVTGTRVGPWMGSPAKKPFQQTILLEEVKRRWFIRAETVQFLPSKDAAPCTSAINGAPSAAEASSF
eukprot:GEMP01046402.1.p1 GENE.GEMP01046402.1~~GEMP01046402.1.p1  ORF type:complete len:167 (+),score=35.02 GEMP01046402.1:103-603(+)